MPPAGDAEAVDEELPPPNPYMHCTLLGADCSGASCLPLLPQQRAPDSAACSSSLGSAVTVVVCTSPIPSHPSPALLEATLESLTTCTGGVEHCRTVVVCDGCTIDEANPHSKWGRVTAAQSDDYEAFKATLRRQAAAPTRRFELIELPSHHGFARAVLAAVRGVVQTDLCLVVQHDWLFIPPGFDVLGASEAMLKHRQTLPYVGAMSLSTVDYEERAKRRYGIDIEPGALSFGSQRFLPLLMLQDKPFLAERQWLCELCLATPIGKFPEDTVGQRQLDRARNRGLQAREANRLYRTYVLDQRAPVTYHLSGRKARADSDNKVAGVGSRSNVGVVMQHRSRDDRVSGSGFVRGAIFGHAAVAGLSPSATTAENGCAASPFTIDGLPEDQISLGKRFKGRCFICGRKGHSKAYCPARDRPETC